MFLPAAVTVDYKPPSGEMLYTVLAAVLVSAEYLQQMSKGGI